MATLRVFINRGDLVPIPAGSRSTWEVAAAGGDEPHSAPPPPPPHPRPLVVTFADLLRGAHDDSLQQVKALTVHALPEQLGQLGALSDRIEDASGGRDDLVVDVHLTPHG